MLATVLKLVQSRVTLCALGALLPAAAAFAQSTQYARNPASRFPITSDGVVRTGGDFESGIFQGNWYATKGIVESFFVDTLPPVAPGPGSMDEKFAAYFAAHPEADGALFVGSTCAPWNCGEPSFAFSYHATVDTNVYNPLSCSGDYVDFTVEIRNPQAQIYGFKFSGDPTNYALRVYASNTFEFYVSGHAFCALIDDGNFVKFGKNTLRYLPLTSGRIIDESTTLWTDYIEWPLTRARYNAAISRYRELKRLSDLGDDVYWVFKQNCVEFAAQIAEAAGVQMPRYTMFVPPWSPDPGVLSASIRWHVEHDGGCQPEVRPSGRCVSPGHFHGGNEDRYVVSAEALLSHTLADPDGAAASFLSTATYHDVPQVTVGRNLVLSMDISGFDPEQSLLVTDFGDGSAPSFDSKTGHAYAKEGPYQARIILIGSAGIQVIRMPVTVSKKGGSATASIEIPALTPLEQPLNSGEPAEIPPFARTFPADPTCDWVADGEDLAMVLAAWGSTDPTLADIDEDGVVSGNDLAVVLAGWGAGSK